MSLQPAPAVVSAPSRARSLDGLRGLAAIEVLVYHAMLLNPTLANYFQLGTQPATASAADLVLRSPLHLFMLGNEAVLVFFVISGVVLTMQTTRPAFTWAGYFPGRLLRLYLPVLASLLLAVVLALAFHTAVPHESYWVQISSFPSVTFTDILKSAELLYGDPVLNGPLWSLRWEVLFSVFLPVFVLLNRGSKMVSLITMAAATLLMWIGVVAQSPALQFLPAFAVGVALVPFVAGDAEPRPGRRHFGYAAALLVSLALLLGRYVLEPYDGDILNNALYAAALPGAAGLVLVAVRWRPLHAVLSSAFARWLGRISFSLYLVHVPVIVALANAAPSLPWQATAAIGVLLSLTVAVLFERLVERPSHQLSRRVATAHR